MKRRITIDTPMNLLRLKRYYEKKSTIIMIRTSLDENVERNIRNDFRRNYDVEMIALTIQDYFNDLTQKQLITLIKRIECLIDFINPYAKQNNSFEINQNEYIEIIQMARSELRNRKLEQIMA